MKLCEDVTCWPEPHTPLDHATPPSTVLEAHRGFFASVADYERFAVSPHKQDGHMPSRAVIPGCEWCRRWQELEDAFHGRAPQAPAAAAAPESPTLWGAL